MEDSVFPCVCIVAVKVQWQLSWVWCGFRARNFIPYCLGAICANFNTAQKANNDLLLSWKVFYIMEINLISQNPRKGLEQC